MPELPDITIYIEALETRITGHVLQRVQLNSSFLVRTATPPIKSIEGKKVLELRRLGKRICLRFEGDLWLVLHLMIAGRLHWKAETRPSGRLLSSSRAKNHLVTFHFDHGALSLTEAGTQRRASLHLIKGEDSLRGLDRGGAEAFKVDLDQFTAILQSENHTLKRALTDPRLFSGIGNAYSDEILWQARLSPVKLTPKMTDDELERLHRSTREALLLWIERLREETGDSFSEKGTAVRQGMAVHGGYRETR